MRVRCGCRCNNYHPCLGIAMTFVKAKMIRNGITLSAFLAMIAAVNGYKQPAIR